MPIDRVQLKLNAFNRKRKRYGEDLCTISGPTLVDGGADGDSVSLGDLAASVECFIEALGQSSQDVIGGEMYVGSHRIQLPRDAITSAITPEHKITVTSRTPNWIFENPVITEESVAHLVTVNASRVKQGYQQ